MKRKLIPRKLPRLSTTPIELVKRHHGMKLVTYSSSRERCGEGGERDFYTETPGPNMLDELTDKFLLTN